MTDEVPDIDIPEYLRSVAKEVSVIGYCLRQLAKVGGGDGPVTREVLEMCDLTTVEGGELLGYLEAKEARLRAQADQIDHLLNTVDLTELTHCLRIACR